MEVQFKAVHDDDHKAIDEDSRKFIIPCNLYISRALSAWSDRLWQFGSGIFIIKLSPGDLRLVAIFGLVTMLLSTLFGAAVGDWIDKHPRLVAARTFLIIQNTMTTVSCTILAVYFGFESSMSATWIYLSVTVSTIAIASLATLASLGSKIVVEKDWVPAIAGGNENVLTVINSRFRTLDLICNLLAPLLAGVVFFIGSFEAAVFIGVWNLVSCPFEYGLLRSVFNNFPVLANKVPYGTGDTQEASTSPSSSWRSVLTTTRHGWQMYFKHPVFPAAFALALVYMTVLGFDNITYAYILTQCVPEPVLGALVGSSAVVGVMAASAFPLLQRRIGLHSTGLIGMMWLVLSLVACVVSIWLSGSPFGADNDGGHNSNGSNYNDDSSGTAENVDNREECVQPPSFLSVYVMLAGIVVSRFGLWLVDLSISTMMQKYIKEEHRGILGGVQGSMQQFFEILKFVLAISLPGMGTFGWLVLCSYVFYCAAACSYLVFIRSANKKAEANDETI